MFMTFGYFAHALLRVSVNLLHKIKKSDNMCHETNHKNALGDLTFLLVQPPCQTASDPSLPVPPWSKEFKSSKTPFQEQ